MKTERKLTEKEQAIKEQWRARPWKEREAYIPDVLVMHPKFVHAVNEINRRADRVATQKKGAAITIIGPTGSGKSTLAEFVKKQRPDEEIEDRSIRRAVHFTIPPRPSSPTMSSAVLHAMGDPRWKKGKADELQERTITLMRKCSVEVVLIDNIHDVPERRTVKGIREVGNWIRNIYDQVPALFVLLGAEQGLSVLHANNQAKRRGPATIDLEYFTCENPAGTSRLRRYLHELDIKLPTAEMSGLSSFETAKRIWIASYGVPAYITELLTEALEISVKAGNERIDHQHLAAGFNKLLEDRKPPENPFEPGATLRVLDGEGDPFEDWLDDGYE